MDRVNTPTDDHFCLKETNHLDGHVFMLNIELNECSRRLKAGGFVWQLKLVVAAEIKCTF